MEKITHLIFILDIDESSYNQVLEYTQQQLEQYRTQQPYEKGKLIFNKIMKNNVTIYNEMINEIKQITYKDFKKEYNAIQKSIYINAFFNGYIESKQILKIESFIQPNLNQDKNNLANFYGIDESKIDDMLIEHSNIEGSYIVRTTNDLPEEINHATINYFQIGTRDVDKSLMMNLMELIWGNLFYYNLRTVKQLGYIVGNSKYIKDNQMVYI